MQSIQERILDAIEDRVSKADMACYVSEADGLTESGAIYAMENEKTFRCMFCLAYLFDTHGGKVEFFLRAHEPKISPEGDNPNAHRTCRFLFHDGSSVQAMLKYLEELCEVSRQEKRSH
ncbi:Hypothetical protein PBC10988_22170 [Planctomycetales bacterium 10988]|nr:Hypothetical protein PBC10988_22170 [Planctomycetales bacterium 10988]